MLIQDRTCIEAVEYLCYTESDQNWAFITPNLPTPFVPLETPLNTKILFSLN